MRYKLVVSCCIVAGLLHNLEKYATPLVVDIAHLQAFGWMIYYSYFYLMSEEWD